MSTSPQKIAANESERKPITASDRELAIEGHITRLRLPPCEVRDFRMACERWDAFIFNGHLINLFQYRGAK